MSTTTLRLISCVFLVFAAFAVYANALQGDFVYDDTDLVRDNPALRPPLELSTLGRNPSADRGIKSFYYRPFVTLTYALDYRFWELDVRGYHLGSVLWHALATLAVFLLVFQLKPENLTAFFTARLLTRHPAHTEAVAYISGRADPLFVFFLLLSFMFYVRVANGTGPASGQAVLMGALYALALLCKEHALILMALAGFYNLIFRKKLKLLPALLLVAVTAWYLYLRLYDYRLLGLLHPHKSAFDLRAPGVFAALAEYGRLLVWPVGLHMEHGIRFFSWRDPRVLVGLGMFLTMLYALRIHWRRPEISFPLVWFLVTLAPVSNLFSLNAWVAEHWLYLPSIGAFMLVSHFWALWLRSQNRRMAVAALLAAVAALGALTVRQNATWRDAVEFYRRTLRFVPASARMHNNLGTTLKERGQVQEALEALEAAVKLAPGAAESQYNLGTLYALQGRVDEAIVCLQKATQANPNFYLAHYNLGALSEGRGQNDLALSCYRKAVQINPRYELAYDQMRKLEKKLEAAPVPAAS